MFLGGSRSIQLESRWFEMLQNSEGESGERTWDDGESWCWCCRSTRHCSKEGDRKWDLIKIWGVARSIHTSWYCIWSQFTILWVCEKDLGDWMDFMEFHRRWFSPDFFHALCVCAAGSDAQCSQLSYCKAMRSLCLPARRFKCVLKGTPYLRLLSIKN